MKFTLSWLREYLDTSASLNEICQKLTEIGLEVELLEDKAKILAPFSVAKIIEAKPHENSAKLKICQVSVADFAPLLQIICGAANAKSGLKVAYAPVGSVIPVNQMLIKKARIAGFESNGMLCSARELNLGDEDAGIIEIDEKWPVGTKINEVFALNDALIEINVTPNRADCLGISGIARDLAATKIGTLKNPVITDISPQFLPTIPFPFAIKNEAPDVCTYAAFRYLKNIKNCQSPKWLQDRLKSVGINSVSAIVDITNYVMLALNRPLHAYDASKIKEVLKIRFAADNEKFISLKNEVSENKIVQNREFILDNKILVISDSAKILALAGIIGGASSSCKAETTEIILESAFFSPAAIAYGGRKLSILSDARFRFERGIDENSCESGIDLATRLILEICGDKDNKTAISATEIIGKKSAARKLDFDLNKIEKLTGLKVTTQDVVAILSDLGFGLKKITEENFLVEIPSYRHDISCSADLVEEVVRIFGYNKISKKPILQAQDKIKIKEEPNIIHKVRLHLALQGMTEVINWSFTDAKLVKDFGEINEKLILQNPVNIELNHLRPSLIIGLIQSYEKNCLRNFSDLALFEIGNVFCAEEKLMIAGLRAGKNKEPNHYHEVRDFDVFDVKKDFFAVAEIFGLRSESLQINTANAPKYYHPYRFASLKLGKNLIGYFGEIHPLIAKKFALKNRVNVFEIFVEAMPQSDKLHIRKPFIINDLPVVERDFAFLTDQDQAVGDIIKTITSCDKQAIKEVRIFDIFTGSNIPGDKKSVALRVKIQPAAKTLTSQEIEIISKKIIAAVFSAHGSVLRA
jgi:phenylalanyl-tRNA synthetase beta chain